MLIVLGGYGLITLTVQNQRKDALAISVICALIIVCGVLFYFAKRPLKKVSLDEKYLYISDYFDEIQLPLSEIKSVSETGLGLWGTTRFPHRQIIIRLKSESKFGDEIIFGMRIELIKRPEGIDILNKVLSETKI